MSLRRLLLDPGNVLMPRSGEFLIEAPLRSAKNPQRLQNRTRLPRCSALPSRKSLQGSLQPACRFAFSVQKSPPYRRDQLDYTCLSIFRKVWVSIKFLSAKFGFTSPPPKEPKMRKDCTN